MKETATAMTDTAKRRPTARAVYTSFDELPLMLSLPQTAAVLGISRSAAYSLAAEGALPLLRIGGRKVVPKEALREWIKERTESAFSAGKA